MMFLLEIQPLFSPPPPAGMFWQTGYKKEKTIYYYVEKIVGSHPLDNGLIFYHRLSIRKRRSRPGAIYSQTEQS